MTERTPLQNALIDATAHLAGVVSAYEQYVGRHNRRGRRDPLYETRIKDFKRALNRALKAVKELA